MKDNLETENADIINSWSPVTVSVLNSTLKILWIHLSLFLTAKWIIYNKAHFLCEFVWTESGIFQCTYVSLPQTKALVFPSQTVLLISLPGYVIPRSAERNTPWSLLTLHHFPPILSYNKIKYNTNMHVVHWARLIAILCPTPFRAQIGWNQA